MDELTADELKEIYLRYVEGRTYVELFPGSEGIILALPINYDSPELYFRDVEGGWEVSDDGMTLSELETLGWDLTEDVVWEKARSVARTYGFRLREEHRAFFKVVKREGLGKAINDFHQLVLTMRVWGKESGAIVKNPVDDLLEALQPYGVLPVTEMALRESPSFVGAAVRFALLTLSRLGLVAETGNDSWRRVE